MKVCWERWSRNNIFKKANFILRHVGLTQPVSQNSFLIFKPKNNVILNLFQDRTRSSLNVFHQNKPISQLNNPIFDGFEAIFRLSDQFSEGFNPIFEQNTIFPKTIRQDPYLNHFLKTTKKALKIDILRAFLVRIESRKSLFFIERL